MKKTIVISLPCYNEEKNIENIVMQISTQFEKYLLEYEYIIQFSDNCSTDNTRSVLRELCKSNNHVRAIFNVSNVSGSAIHSILQSDGDCCIHMASDLQEPPDIIPQLVKKWEDGAKVVCAIKIASDEKKIMWKIRTLYYKIMIKCSSIPQIEHFTGFGLYDRQFIEIIRQIEDPLPTLRGYVAEYGYNISKVSYKQECRKKGVSSQNFLKNFDYAMKSFTTYSKTCIHLITILGVILIFFSLLLAVALLILNIIGVLTSSATTFFLVNAIFFFSSVQMFLIGLVGEYIVNINVRMLKRPLAIEAERVGFSEKIEPKPENISPYSSIQPKIK